MIHQFFVGCTRSRTAFWLAALAILLWAHPALAATRTVDTLTDSAGLTACTAAANDCSLRGALSGAGANDTINFDPSLANQTITLALGQLLINQPLTLDGSTAPTVTVSGDNLSRVISTTQPLTVTSLILANGRVPNGNGGALYAGGDLWLIDSVIRNSVTIGDGTRSNGYGGGAYVVGAATLTGATILNNYADFYGGGVYVKGAATLMGATIVSNTTSSFDGGGAYLLADAAILHTIFLNNKGGDGGGAFVGGAARIAGATFGNNQGYDGGGIYVGADATITGTSVHSNSGWDGGGVYISGTVSITETTFLSNTTMSNRNGGGVYVGGDATLSAVDFLSNTAYREGGGVYVGGDATLTDSRFFSNLGDAGGGGAKIAGDATIRETTFRQNTGMEGGGLQVSGTASITDTTFFSNTSMIGGGANVGAARIAGTSFVSNTATVFGGGGLRVGGDATITGTTFLRNVGGNGGGGAVVGGDARITNTTFTSNRGKIAGGGVEVSGDATILGATFLSNSVGAWGGGAWVGGAATITRTTFVSNTANQSGGGLYLAGKSSRPASVVNSLFARNRSGYNEGDALYLFGQQASSTLTLLHNTLANPTLEDGAAIYVRAGTMQITNTLIANHAIAIEREGGTVSEDYTLFADITTPLSGTVTAGTHSITGPAAFFDTTHYTLTANSAAINMGVASAISTDFAGEARPQQGVPDIGYDESPYKPLPLQVQLTATPPNGALVKVGDVIRYTITVSSRSAPATGVVITATVPTNTELIPGSVNPPTATPVALTHAAARAAANALVWRIDTLAAGQPVVVSYSVRLTSTAAVMNSVQVSTAGSALMVNNTVNHQPDPNTGNQPVASRRLFLPVVTKANSSK